MISVETNTRPRATIRTNSKLLESEGPVRCGTPKGLHPDASSPHRQFGEPNLSMRTLGLAHGKDRTLCVEPANRSIQSNQP